jgi:hypothetical protein
VIDESRIFYARDSGAITFEQVTLTQSSELIVAEWARINNAERFEVAASWDCNGYEIPSEDPNAPDAVVGYVVGDTRILNISANEFLPDELVRTLAMTLYEFSPYDLLTVGAPNSGESLTAPFHTFAYTRTHRDVQMQVTDVSSAGLTYAFVNRGERNAMYEPAFALYVRSNSPERASRWWNLTAGVPFPEPALYIPPTLTGTVGDWRGGAEVDFEQLFGGLPEGVYRFVKHIDGGFALGGYELSFYFAIDENGEYQVVMNTRVDTADDYPALIDTPNAIICLYTGSLASQHCAMIRQIHIDDLTHFPHCLGCIPDDIPDEPAVSATPPVPETPEGAESFFATIVSINENVMLVQGRFYTNELQSASIPWHMASGFDIGDMIEVYCCGLIFEGYPLRLANVYDVRLVAHRDSE